VACAGLLLAACGDDDDGGDGTATTAASDPELELGAQVYSQRCQACHGDNGQGGVGPQLGGGAVVESLPDVEDHRTVVREGRRGMPSFEGTLSDEEINAVVRYEREVLPG